MKSYTTTIMVFAVMAVLALSVYLMTRDAGRENPVTPHQESPNNRIEGTTLPPNTVQPTQQAFPRAYAAVANDPCSWNYYFWGGALLIDTLFLENAKAKAPKGNIVTGYVVDYDLWYPELTLTVPKAITLDEALDRIKPPYGKVVRWLSGPNFYLVKPGCEDDEQAATPIR